MLYIIFAMSVHLALVTPARVDTTREEVALVVPCTTTAQERDLQSARPGGHVEWGTADTPKDTSVSVAGMVFHMKWYTTAAGDERARVAPATSRNTTRTRETRGPWDETRGSQLQVREEELSSWRTECASLSLFGAVNQVTVAELGSSSRT